MEINKGFYFKDKEHTTKTKAKKKQIILTNTTCTFEEYLVKIKTRYNGKYTKVPCFSISRDGDVYQHYDVNSYNDMLSEYGIEKNGITVALENVGWLHKDVITGKLVDWKGSYYTKSVINIPWRGKKVWADYTETQYTKLVELIDYLSLKHGIEKDFVGTNIIIDKPGQHKGILNRSNYSKNYYDLSPAFDFKKLTKLINKSYE